MWGWVDRLGGLVLDATLGASALLSLVALAMLASRQPARRAWLARAAILAAPAILPLVALAPVPRVELVGLARESGLARHPLLRSWAGDAVDLDPDPDTEDEPGMSAGPTLPGPAAWLLARPGRARWLARGLVVAYLSGVALGLARLALGYWGLGRLTRHAAEPSAATRALYGALPCRGRRPRLRVLDRVGRPVLVGLWRPTILIPTALDAPGASGPLRLSLLHELAHAEGSDPCFLLAGALAQAVWFFLPPLWWLRAQLRLDQEFLADRRAAVGYGALPSYAASLLDLAAPPPASSSAPTPRATATAPVGVEGSALFRRVLMLVQCPFPVERRPPSWWGWSLPALIAGVTLGVSTLSLRGASHAIRPAPASAPPSRARTFHMARLSVEPRPANQHGRAPLVELPIRLPERFTLDVEIWGDRATLTRGRVVGLRLGPIDPTPDRGPGAEPAAWHHVRIRREARGVSIWVDDRTVVATAPPEPPATTTWLSIEPPPDTPAFYRDLRLFW